MPCLCESAKQSSDEAKSVSCASDGLATLAHGRLGSLGIVALEFRLLQFN